MTRPNPDTDPTPTSPPDRPDSAEGLAADDTTESNDAPDRELQQDLEQRPVGPGQRKQ
jgi:hypothetical protein